MAKDVFLVLKVYRVNAINELIDLCGHDDPKKAYKENANTLRAMFGESVIQNAVYPAKNAHEVKQFNADFFNQTSVTNTDQIEQSLVVIKPNAAKNFGDVIRAHLIGQKFEIIHEKVFHFSPYFYSNMIFDCPKQIEMDVINYMASGSVIALIVQLVMLF